MTRQYLRTVSLIVCGDDGVKKHSLDLSDLHVRFRIFSATVSTMNHADITIWNLSKVSVSNIFKEFTAIALSVGYGGTGADGEGEIDSGEGIIFQGEISRIDAGKENAVDSYVRIFAQDGDSTVNWCMTNATIAEGHTDDDIYRHLMQDFTGFEAAGGISLAAGYKPPFQLAQSPDARVMYGLTSSYMDALAKKQDCHWFIEDGKVIVVPKRGAVPDGEIEVLNSQTGVVGVPTLTLDGINVTCLMNPNIRNGRIVQLDNSAISSIDFRFPIQGVDEPSVVVPGLSSNGMYKVHCVEHTGDNRGNDWYTTLIAVAVDAKVPAQGLARYDVATD